MTRFMILANPNNKLSMALNSVGQNHFFANSRRGLIVRYAGMTLRRQGHMRKKETLRWLMATCYGGRRIQLAMLMAELNTLKFHCKQQYTILIHLCSI